jgi:outer membrane receptor for ferrienterochelin and colicins
LYVILMFAMLLSSLLQLNATIVNHYQFTIASTDKAKSNVSVNNAPDTTKPRVPTVPQKKRKSQIDSLRKKYLDTLTYKVDQVVVTGTRNEVLLKDSPVRVEVIDKEQIKSTAMVTAGDLLKEQTGLVIAQGTVRNGIQMMGLSPDYTMILVDGQPLNGRIGGVIDLNRLSVGNIERIEIVKGPMSSLYGSEALAGVINIITRKPDNGYTGRAYLQFIEKGAKELQLEQNYANDDLVIAGYGNLKKAEPFSLNSGGRDYPYAGFRDYTLQLRTKWYAQSNLTFSSNIRAFGSESEGRFSDGAAGNITQNEGSVQTTDRNATLGMDWTHGKARLSTQLYGTVYNETYNFDVDQGSAGRTDNLRRRTFRSYLQYDVLWNLKNRFTFGGDFLYDDILGSRYGGTPLYRTSAFFAQWEGNPTEDWAYALSIRYDKNSAFQAPTSYFLNKVLSATIPILPRFSITYKPTSSMRIYATAGEGFKAPDFRQLFVQFSNRLPGAGYELIGSRLLGIDLMPEQSYAFDLGLFHQTEPFPFLGTDLILAYDIRGFYNNIRNFIEFYPVANLNNTFSYRNIAQIFTQGIEASIQYRFLLSKTQHISGQIGYQLLDARDMRIAEGISNGTVAYVIPSTGETVRIRRSDYGGLWYRSAHTGVLRVQYDNSEYGITANVRLQYVGRFGDQQLSASPDIFDGSTGTFFGKALISNNEYVPGFSNINCTFTKRFITDYISSRSMLTLSCGVNNLLNNFNPERIPNLIGRQIFMNMGIDW